tara:strand:+ start:169 stop:1818 length:1650 start_codon:yes stop_codon:yes gene_type:complete
LKKYFLYFTVIFLISSSNLYSQCQLNVLPDTVVKVCYGDSLILVAQNTSLSNYIWSPSTYLDSNSNDTVVFHSPNSGSFSLKVISLDSLQCKDSAIINIEVFDSFSQGSIDSSVYLCSNVDSAVINFVQFPSGDDGFSFDWLFSSDGFNFTNYSSLDTSFLELSTIDTSLYYTVIISSINGCGIDTANISALNYYPPFQIGTILGSDTLCRYYPLDTIYQSVLTTGGSGNYNYVWLSSFDGLQWDTISNANNSYYLPGGLVQNTFFNLEVNDLCGTDITNILFDSILPSPTIIDILGDSIFCANQHDNFFWINETFSNISYDWQITGGSIFQQISDSALAADMDDVTGNVDIQLLMTHVQTNCQVQVSKTVTTTSNSSPNRTQIIRKPNSNILVCDDSSENLIYQWGWTEKSSQVDTEIPGADLRYVLLPHSFDSTTYRYWVKTTYDYSNGDFCETYSYLGPSPITSDKLIYTYSELMPYPNPSTGVFYLSYTGIQFVQLKDQFGRSYDVTLSRNGNNSSIDISLLNTGIYFLNVKNRENSFVYTLIKH